MNRYLLFRASWRERCDGGCVSTSKYEKLEADKKRRSRLCRRKRPHCQRQIAELGTAEDNVTDQQSGGQAQYDALVRSSRRKCNRSVTGAAIPGISVRGRAEQIFSTSGRAVLKDSGKAVLKTVGEALKVPTKQNHPVVGYTDNVPSPSPFRRLSEQWNCPCARDQCRRYLQDVA